MPSKRRSQRQRHVRVGNHVEIVTANKLLFRGAARDQRCCRMCGRARGDFEAHHVIYEQHLRKLGQPLFCTLNALRLCHDCHRAHHQRRQIVPIAKLTDLNIDYAFHVLGLQACDYLGRYYETHHRLPDGSLVPRLDARVEQAIAREEAA
jgi:hypothetical protein